ncbi:MAG TPA: protein kinase [Pyrinomonadaceae bacterium]|jgi:serine/threonine protein kinase/Flp pilus assembly protein TadD|nr:protein kinase [Pyrinomonadaceae bacterium]
MNRERWRQVDLIFESALERRPDERADYLSKVCDGDEVLRREIESLMVHDQVNGFMERSASGEAKLLILKNAPRPHAGQTIGHYRILKQLGAGGMGEIFLAEDTLLNRRVSLKLLSPQFTTDPERVRRFRREALAASTLNHPNILTIYEIAEANDKPIIATEYVEGVTLRRRMRSKRLSVANALEIALQMAAALAAAHSARIVHRDIKPENVMVRPDGLVKVLDFGIAKYAEPTRTPHSEQSWSTTATGAVIGTTAYMSPEQARGETVDARTDIWSLGVILYEMITRQLPFPGKTPNERIAAILEREPVPLGKVCRGVPEELERIVRRALAKKREERYARASDLAKDLRKLHGTQSAESFFSFALRAPVSNLLGLSRARLTIALVALSFLIIAAWFSFHRSPVLTNHETILLADFENKTGDEVFDVTLKQGLAMQLEQSSFLNLFPEARVRQTLRLMGHRVNDRVTAQVAREICLREGIKALIASSIAPLGNHYVITIEAMNGQTGETLVRAQVEADSKEQVLRKLSLAAAQLREKLGESLSSIQQSERLLEDATTSNLEAFKFHSQAVALAVSGRELEAIPFEKRAVELDPDFAYAWSILSITHFGTRRPGLAAEYATKAYALRDRVSEFEQLRLTHRYHYLVTGDVHKAIEALLLQKRTFPAVSTASSDLALTYYWMGQTDQAIAEARESLRLYPNFFVPHLYLGLALVRLNHFEEAREVFSRAVEQNLVHPEMRSALYQLAYINGDTTGMQQQIDWANGRPDEYIGLDWQTAAAAFAGQWRRAQDFSRRAINLANRGETKEIAAHYARELALRGAVFGDCRRARADATLALSLERGRISLPRAALALALCGEVNQVKPLTDEIVRRYPDDTILNELWLPIIRAASDLQHGNAAQAVEQIQTTSRYEAAAEFWASYLRGQAYLKLGRGLEASAEFQKILEHRGYGPLSVLYPLANLGSARATAMAGETAKSRKAYEDFFAAWQAADRDVPILIEAKKDYEKLK